uniref:Uncharacterized protein n=1 Tax=Rhizophora mucronata TaxID=61149 RepID=A0A2P2NV84_RHIMU
MFLFSASCVHFKMEITFTASMLQ